MATKMKIKYDDSKIVNMDGALYINDVGEHLDAVVFKNQVNHWETLTSGNNGTTLELYGYEIDSTKGKKFKVTSFYFRDEVETVAIESLVSMPLGDDQIEAAVIDFMNAFQQHLDELEQYAPVGSHEFMTEWQDFAKKVYFKR